MYSEPCETSKMKEKKLMAFIHGLFLQNTPSLIFGRVLIMSLDYLSCFAVVLRAGVIQEFNLGVGSHVRITL